MYRDEEESYADPVLVARLRERLARYLAGILQAPRPGVDGDLALEGKGCVEGRGFKPRRVAVVDGGSNILPLNAGYVGVVVSMGILVEDNRVAERVIEEPEFVPPSPLDLGEYESMDQVKGVVDKLREAKVFEAALRLLAREPELLVVDGPLIPHGVLARRSPSSVLEAEALERYREAVLELYREAARRNVSLVGFVKRPRSRLLSRETGVAGIFDHILLSPLLGEAEYAPRPPRPVLRAHALFHDREIAGIVEATEPRYTFIRMSRTHPPFRVDFGYTAHSYEDILSYLYSTRTREGIPYLLAKVDEEVKIRRRLLRDLYEDVLHTHIAGGLAQDPSSLVSILPEHGGEWL